MDENSSDFSLLQQYLAGSRAALDELVRRHLPMVYAAAMREVRDPHLADDVTQAVFLVLMKRAGSISPSVVLAGWLFKTTCYVASDARKMASRRVRHEREAAMQSAEIHSDSPEVAQLTPLLNAAIASLPAKYRDAVVMAYLEGKSHEEVAVAQQVTETVSRQRLFRGLQKLREYCARRGVGISEAMLGSVLGAASLQSPPPTLLARVESTLSSPGAGAPAEIAQHTLRSMTMFKLKIGLSAAAALLVIISISMPWAIAQSGTASAQPAPQAGSSDGAISPPPASQPAADDTALSPQQVLVRAFQSANNGDVEKHLTYFHNLTPAQQIKQRKVAGLLMAIRELSEAASKKFGGEVGERISMMSGLDLSETQLGEAAAEINGETATIDLKGAGPGKVPMVKTPEGWRISSSVIDQFSNETADRMPTTLRKATQDINNGKITTPQELMAALGWGTR